MALIALSMVALLSAVALAVDVGMLVTARTEAQRVSDLSALAGAGILAVQPDAEALARITAIEFALLNTVQGEAAVVLPEDVDVNLDSSTVTVRTIRTQTRGTPVGTFFARVFGVNSVDITATATAIAEPAGSGVSTNCLLPIMLPDRWAEIEGTGPWAVDGSHFAGVDDSFDPRIDEPKPGEYDSDGAWDTYIPPGPGVLYPTGYDDSVIGDTIEIHKAGGGGGGLNQSWYYPWTPMDAEDQFYDGGPGAATYLDRFTNCMVATYKYGDFVLTEPGAMVGPTNTGFDDIYALDPAVYWEPNPPAPYGPEGCVWRPAVTEPPTDAGCTVVSERIRRVPMFDPTQAPASGRKAVPLTNFGSVFVAEPQPGNTFTAIWLGTLVSVVNPEPDPIESLPKYIHLIR
jgi:hypothetical protein